MEKLAETLQVKESVEDELLKRPGVTAVGVGYKYVNGQRTDEISVQVFVRRKRKNVPRKQMVPKTINGVPTDVIERTFVLQQLADRVRVEDITLMADTTHYDPLKGGISIGPCRAIGGYVFAGTLGAVARDNATNDILLLSNFHVMCVDTGWAVGDQMTQPSRVDTGHCPADVVGTLLRAQLTAAVDAAVCTLSGRGYACEIVDIGTVTGTATATLGMAVRKRGRTTGLTYGTVDSISLSVNVDYDPSIGTRTLTNQIGVTPDLAHNPKFGDHGDSGSVVVNNAREVVGLHFAGSDDGYGVANPIAAVLAALNISLCVAPTKSVIKDFVDNKRFRKELKLEKLEIKERKFEKFELKEIEGKPWLRDGPKSPKELVEGGRPPVEQPVQPPVGGPPAAPGAAGSLEERLAQLEAAVGQLATFISPELRPEMNTGSLAGEGDLSQADLAALGQQLQKEANDAVLVKTNFDTQLPR